MLEPIEPLNIRIDRRLDIDTARSVAHRVRIAAREREVVIDLGPDVDCDVFALSLLAEIIAQRRSPVRVLGLSGHAFRILEYLGVRFPPSTRERLG